MEALKPRTKRVSLAFMGDGWDEAYIEMHYLSWEESKRIDEEVETIKADAIQAEILAIQKLFVSGKGLSANDELIALTNDHIPMLDLEAIHQLYRAVLGLPDPKGSPS